MKINHTQAEAIGDELHGFLRRMLREGEALPFREGDLVWSDAVQHVLREARALVEETANAAEVAADEASAS